MSAKNLDSNVGARLGHRVSIRALKKGSHPRYNWRATYIEAGARRQKYFRTKKDAEKWATERESEAIEFGTGSVLTSSERSAVIEMRQSLAELELDLRSALAFAVENFRKTNRSVTVERLIREVVDARARSGCSSKHLVDLKGKLGRFEKSFGKRSAATVTRDEVGDWLHRLDVAPSSINSYRRILVLAFNDAVESGYILENPAAKVKQVKVIETEIGILTPGETAKLLASAGIEILPAIAIGAFAGVRDAELKRIDWSDISLDQSHVRIRAANAKSARSRLIRMSDNLKAWLEPLAKQSGAVWPPNGRKLHEAARKAAGFGTENDLTPGERNDGLQLKSWPDNALRHSYASYHLAFHQNANELALHLGHADTKVIFQHYRELVTGDEARAYWAILPSS